MEYPCMLGQWVRRLLAMLNFKVLSYLTLRIIPEVNSNRRCSILQTVSPKLLRNSLV